MQLLQLTSVENFRLETLLGAGDHMHVSLDRLLPRPGLL